MDWNLDVLDKMASVGAFCLAVVFAFKWRSVGRALGLIKRPPAPVRAAPAREVYGRDEAVEAIRASLMNHETGVILPSASAVAVTGTGGLGKTTLAKLCAQRFKGEFDQIHFIPAETETQLLHHLGAIVGTEAEGGARARAEAALRVLKASDKSWLIIYDNVPSRDFITPWIPDGRRTHCLITTRIDDWNRPGFRAHRLDRLTPGAAVTVLTAEAQRTDPDPNAGRLAEALDFLPLGLVQAGALLREDRTKSCADYLADMGKVIQTASQAGDYPDSIFKSVTLSLRGLPLDEIAILNVFAYLAPDGLEARLLTDVATSERPPEFLEDLTEPLRDLAADRSRVERALASLARRSLLAPEGTEGAARYSLHRLTAAVVRARLATPRDEVSSNAKAAAAVVAAAFPGGSRNPAYIENWPDCARLASHVATLHRLEAPGPPRTAAMDYLYNQASIYLGEQAQHEAARVYAQAGLAIKVARLGPDHRAVGAGQTSLGLRLQALGELDAAERALREALRITQALGAAAAEDLPIDLSNHATVLVDLGVRELGSGEGAAATARFEEAEGKYLEALRLDQAAGRRADEATNLNNLAGLYAKMGRRNDALARAGEAVAVWRESDLRGDDPRFASFLNMLGALRLEAGDPAAARGDLEAALGIFEAAFRDNATHPDPRDTAGWLAACLFALDRPEGAAAEALCARYGLDPDAHRAAAAQIMGRG